MRALKAQNPRAGVVEGQCQTGQIGQMLQPIGEVRIVIAGQLLLLPGGIVRVLDGQRWRVEWLAGHQGACGVTGLAVEHAHGPSVRNDVVHGHRENLTLVGAPDQMKTQERRLRQIKWLRRDHVQQLRRAGRAFIRFEMAEIGDVQRYRQVRHDDLNRPVTPLFEPGAQEIVARHDHVDRLLKNTRIDGACGQRNGRAFDVERTARRQPVEEPEPLLRK